jgi:hypothetical protein
VDAASARVANLARFPVSIDFPFSFPHGSSPSSGDTRRRKMVSVY